MIRSSDVFLAGILPSGVLEAVSTIYESQLSHPFPAPCSVISYWLLEISHGGNVHTMEINKCYTSELVPPPPFLVVKHLHLAAQHCM